MADGPTKQRRDDVELSKLIDEVQRALALEGVDSETQLRVVHRLVYGTASSRRPMPMRRYADAELKLSPAVLDQRYPAQVPDGVRYAVPEILATMYSRAADAADPFAEGHVVAWDLRFEPAAGPQAFGMYVLRATAEVERYGKNMSPAEMFYTIAGIVHEARERREGPQT